MNTQANRSSFRPFGGPISLLESVIVALTSCSLVLFIFTIGARLMGDSTFDNLPEFLKDSYSAIWSAGAVAGGALVGSVIDTFSKREGSRANFFLYILTTTIVVIVLSWATMAVSRSMERPKFTVPYGAQAIDLSAPSGVSTSFLLLNRNFGFFNGPIKGEFTLQNGVVRGKVSDSVIQFYKQMSGTFQNQPRMNLQSVSLHACYSIADKGAISTERIPNNRTSKNGEKVVVDSNNFEPQKIPDFEFEFEFKGVPSSAISPPYICAVAEFDNSYSPQLY